MRYLGIDPGRTISKIGLGTALFGSQEWGYGDEHRGEKAHAIIRRALDLGITLFDTAEVYGFGRSERILGCALGDELESVFLATKVMPILPFARVVQSRAVASANRLGAQKLGLYQVHQPNPLGGDSRLMRGMRALQRAGLVGEVGVSNYSLERWRAAERALGDRILSNQIRYSLVDRSPELDLLPYALASGHVVIAYEPLGGGLLSGKYHPHDRPADSSAGENRLSPAPADLQRADELVAILRGVAREHGVTPAQIALAWVIHHPAVVAVAGASSLEQVEKNAAAADIDLTDSQYQELQAASDRFRSGTTATSPHRQRVSALRHWASSLKYLTMTVWHDYQLQRNPWVPGRRI